MKLSAHHHILPQKDLFLFLFLKKDTGQLPAIPTGNKGYNRFLFFIFYFLFFIFLTHVQAQDVHFSQYYNSPLTLNPAQAGNMKGNARAVLNHRSQWSSISPFVTSAVSFDSRLWADRMNGSAAGAGLLILSDKTGEGSLNNMQVMFNASYHKIAGYERNKMISLGFQAGFFQRRIDNSKLTFGSQFQGEDFNQNIVSGENFSNFSTTKPDYQVGMLYQLNNEGFKMSTGFSLFHITKPDESFISTAYKLPMRTVIHWGSKISLKKESTYILPDMIYMKQNQSAGEINIGGRVEHLLRTEHYNINVGLGASYRLSDALIFIATAEYQKWKAGISYDINVSNLHPASNYNGGFELSVIYTDKLIPGKNKLPVKVPCMRL